MCNEIRLLQLYVDNILLFSVQRLSALIISHYWALVHKQEEITLKYSTLLLIRSKSQLHIVYKCFY